MKIYDYSGRKNICGDRHALVADYELRALAGLLKVSVARLLGIE